MILHWVPFQCSISVAPVLVLFWVELPTAQMSLAEIAATPYRDLNAGDPDWGMKWP